MNEPYRIELTQSDLLVIRRALARAPHDLARPVVDSLAAQIDRIEAERASGPQSALLRGAPLDASDEG